jgi:hypothetical protein
VRGGEHRRRVPAVVPSVERHFLQAAGDLEIHQRNDYHFLSNLILFPPRRYGNTRAPEIFEGIVPKTTQWTTLDVAKEELEMRQDAT